MLNFIFSIESAFMGGAPQAASGVEPGEVSRAGAESSLGAPSGLWSWRTVTKSARGSHGLVRPWVGRSHPVISKGTENMLSFYSRIFLFPFRENNNSKSTINRANT